MPSFSSSARASAGGAPSEGRVAKRHASSQAATLLGGAGNDTLDGGSGIDTAFEQIFAKNPAGIALSPIDDAGFVEPVKAAKDAGAAVRVTTVPGAKARVQSFTTYPVPIMQLIEPGDEAT